MKKVAILQSNYITWKGYFDMIAGVNEFILCDDTQYTRHDWHNRNKMRAPQSCINSSVPNQNMKILYLCTTKNNRFIPPIFNNYTFASC
jgi:hypothetical protein